ncbi:hypothetical protein [Desertihabitans aurantiacus]|uniref:hypothetical protein n=1 Tax=Desertihabitans aurantiacus TaxID=2282477 RepID=UPI000DF85109|nr:hypothetical protein [Desertihabitans aurantiacus]
MNAPHPTRPVFRLSRAAFLRLGAVGVAGAGTGLLAGPTATAAAATVEVDASTVVGPATWRATGFLNGLSADGSSPPDELLRPLRPQTFRGGGSLLDRGWGGGGEAGYLPRWQYVVDTYRRVARGPLRAQYVLVVPDLWGAEGVTLGPDDLFPGDGGDWTEWESFLTRVVGDVKRARMRPDVLQYEIWNEPDYTELYFPRPKEQYEELWRRGVRLIRALDPQARIVGPSFTRITVSGDSWGMDEWLDMTVESDTTPDILSWHDLIPGRDPVDQADLARQLLAERGLEEVELQLNEYPSNVALDPGANSWYLARFEKARIDYGVLAIFGACCTFPQLDGLLTQRGEELLRNGRWWAYQRYASITEDLLEVTPTGVFDAVAGTSHRGRQLRVLLGDETGDGSDLGRRSLTVRGLDDPSLRLVRRGRVTARVERIRDEAVLDQPEVLSDRQLAVTDGTVVVDFDWVDASSAYVVTLGRQDSELPTVALVEADPDPVITLRDRPTEVQVLVRNYTDADLSITPVVSAPPGHQAEAPATVVVPADGDAVIPVVLRRTTADLTGGELEVTVGDQQLSAAVVATDDLARVATFTASSTFTPSSPANLNDGLTDPELWGGGGAGGWNDNTLNHFPDWVLATWAIEETFARVRVHTLDSVGYPAGDWGVRDLDVQVPDGDGWRTVAGVRGNTEGIVELAFPAETADRLRVLVLASNSGDYSRLIEVEVLAG